MGGQKFKFILIGAAIVGAVTFLAFLSFEESKSYYMNVDEVTGIGKKALGKPIKMRGIVENGSITRNQGQLEFSLGFNGSVIKVVYTGKAVIPDNFKGATEVIVNGRVKSGGSFEADGIQAKCASKYQADYNALRNK